MGGIDRRKGGGEVLIEYKEMNSLVSAYLNKLDRNP